MSLLLLLFFACDFGCKGQGCVVAAESAEPPRALELLTRGCDQANSLACGMAAQMLEFGGGVPQDVSRARELYQRACDHGEPEGCISVGNMVLLGKVEGSENEALALMRQGCEAGVVRGCVSEAQLLLLRGQELDRAGRLAGDACSGGDAAGCTLVQQLRGLEEMRQERQLAQVRCDQGVATGCLEVLMLDTHGASGQQGAASARGVLDERCTAGDGARCQDLGFLYSNAVFVEADLGRSAELYRRACELEDHLCGNWGRLHEDGRGVPQDRAKALELYLRACDADGEFSGQACGMGAQLLLEPTALVDVARARALLERSCATSGIPRPCANLGQMLLDGDGGPTDTSRAIELMRRACDEQDGFGCANLGRAYALGIGVPVDTPQATVLLEKGCRYGAQFACDALMGR